MAVVVSEPWDNREWTRGENGRASLRFWVTYDPASDDEDDIESALFAEAPATYRGLKLQTAMLRDDQFNRMLATVNYGAVGLPDTTGSTPPEFAFEMATETMRQMVNLATVNQGAISGRVAPNNRGLIGVTDKGVDGVDVPAPVYSFSEIHYFQDSAITEAYKVALAGLVGTVNNGSFRGYAAGELLSTGISGNQKGDDLWQLRYQWSAMPNVTVTATGFTSFTKRGWDYLEWHYDELEDTTNKIVLKRPFAYTLHQVLRYTAYSGFGIGS